MHRLRSERLVSKFVLKFLDDDSCDLLNRSLASGDYKEAFRAAHTVKGVCQNLGFTKLYEASSRLSEALRGGGLTSEVPELVEQVQTEYARTVSTIRTFQKETGA